MATLEIKIDPDVYKLHDDKVQALLSGKLTVEAFALLIRTGDPYVLVGDTIYALTEAEFYAMSEAGISSDISEAEFTRVTGMEDLSFMSLADAALMRRIRKELPKCSACKYRRYRTTIAAGEKIRYTGYCRAYPGRAR